MTAKKRLPTCLEFAAMAMKPDGKELTPAQRVLVKVCFDGKQPADLEAEERALFVRMFGDIGHVPPEALAVLVWCIGARSGKSYLCALYAAWRAFTADVSALARGETAYFAIVSTDIRNARLILSYCRAIARTVSEKSIQDEAKDSFAIIRPDGARIVIQALPCGRGGAAVRGRSLIGAACDEAAFFQGEDSARNLGDIVAALAPRIMPGGALLLVSTPWTKDGEFYSLFTRNHGEVKDALAAHAPTSLLRPDERTRRMLERERVRDPDNASREFDAAWLDVGSSGLFAPDLIAEAMQAYEHGAWSTPDLHMAAGDAAFVADACTLAICAREGDNFRIVDLLERRPKPGKPLTPSLVIGEWAERCKKYGCESVSADQHAKASVIEHLSAHGIGYVEVNMSRGSIHDRYLRVRDLLASGRLSLIPSERLAKQMAAVVATPLPGGQYKISHPRVQGSHGDLCEAVVLAIDACWGDDGEGCSGGARRFLITPRFGGPHALDWVEDADGYCSNEDGDPDLDAAL